MHAVIRLRLPLQLAALMVGGAAAPPAPDRVARAAGASSGADGAGVDGAGVDPWLVRRGYRPRMVNGELKYRRSETVTGSLFSSTVCLTPNDIKRGKTTPSTASAWRIAATAGVPRRPATSRRGAHAARTFAHGPVI